MEEVTIRQTSVELPALPDEAELVQVDPLGGKRGSVSRSELSFGGDLWRERDGVAVVGLQTGVVADLRARRHPASCR